jgi:hypothetical protein
VAGAALLVPLAACDTEEILRVEDPTFASPETLSSELALPTLIAGGIGDFQVGYSGAGGDSYLSVTGLIADELYSTGTFTTRTAVDQRDLFLGASGNTSDGAFTLLQRARTSLNTAAQRVTEVAGPQDPRLAELRSLQAFTYVALGEAFCSGIPFSDAPNATPGDLGQPLSTAETFQAAAGFFDQALAVNSGSNLGKVGKARALLNNGQYQDAAAAVAGVPTTFVYFIRHSINSGRQNNPIFSLMANRRYGQSNDEGNPDGPFANTIGEGEGLPFRAAMDPRTPFIGPFPGFDQAIPQFISTLYPDFGTDVPLASGVEARLIEAEAAFQADNFDMALGILNTLRASTPALLQVLFPEAPAGFGTALAPLTDPGTSAARADLIFRERGFWLYLTGHRQGDLRRLIRQYGRAQSNVFPSGPYFKGGVYGNDVAFPIPFDEVNNPNFNLDQCNTKAA